ncbi:MAG: MATE family efflux transporter [Lachnospiraceae bacterium]|jgi:multidrug efflux pump|nr:MATE family efflux transporter [Lachnospiraceae bacterium]MCI9327303.1 MATE family efflux transporter [Lachnospiraceae bacterium]
MEKENRNALFETTPVPKAFLTLALPVVMSKIISMIYNMVDIYFIGRTGNANLVAGVSICAPVFLLMVSLGDLFGLGGSSVMSRLFGQKKDEDGKRVSSFTFYSAIATGVLITVIMLIFQTPILHMLGAEGEVLSYAAEYYIWIALGAPFIILTLIPTNQLRTEGLANIAMIGSIVGSVVNIVLDPVFIFGLGMGAGGAAIATVLGNIVTDIIFVVCIRKKSQKLTVDIKMAKVDLAIVGAVFAIGLPSSLNNLMNSFGTALLNRGLASYGADKVAAMGIASKVNMMVAMIMIAFAFGAQALIGYNYGAGNRARLREILKFDLLVQMLIAIAGGALLMIFAPSMIRLFMNDAVIVEAGTLILRRMLLGLPFTGIFLVCSTLFMSAGKSLPTLIMSLSRQGIVFAAALFILSRTLGYTGVITAQPVADMLSALLAVALLKLSKIEI